MKESNLPPALASYFNKLSTDPGSLLFYHIGAYRISLALGVVARLGVADLLKDGARTVSEINESLECNEGNLRRLLYCMVSLGYFEIENDRLKLNNISELLCSDHEHSLRSFATGVGEDVTWGPWGKLYDAVAHGVEPFEEIFKMNFFDYLAGSEKEHERFHSIMGENPFSKLADLIHVGENDVVVDVGGGTGGLVAEICRRHSRCTGIVFDRHVGSIELQEAMYSDGANGERLTWLQGDFFGEIPQGDVYLLSQVLHDWNDEDAFKILRNSKESMNTGGQLFIVERVLEDSGAKNRGNLIDLTMMILTGGRERSSEEFSHLLGRAGFNLISIDEALETRGLHVLKALPVS